ncbi:hypothetical protein N7G274_007783 [Stereocaulon virgatum]|uniref:Uncharacterized protein n=1 Tax=Stereocaulon virgatum TaxID=373712 RepID=A0ABR4A3H6_9LECA
MDKEPESILQQPPTGRGVFEFAPGSHQKEYPKDHVHPDHERFHEGKAHSHGRFDKEDSRTIANKLAAEERRHDPPDTEEVQELKEDPTLPARMHGHEPSKGATIDAEIKEEDEEELRKKGAYGGMDAKHNSHGHGHSHGSEHSHERGHGR